MRSLVTGGAGFIGSHIVERLLSLGHEVIILDNLSTGRRENVQGFLKRSNCSFYEVDIADHDLILPHFHKVDWVFHLAALADIVPSIQRPLDYYHSNASGTAAVVEAARRAAVKRFLYAASSSCYGIPDLYPTPETADIRPQYPYALTKFLAEQIVLHWCSAYKLQVVSLRLFNVYGPRARTSGTYGAVFGVFLAQKLNGRPFTIVGDGTQTRDFTFVSDVVDAFLLAAESDLNGEVCNVGTGTGASVNRLVELLGGGDVAHIPKRPGEPDCTRADIGKIQRLLGWKPQVSLEAGTQVLLENIDYWRNAPVWTPQKIADATKEWFNFLSDRAETRG